MRGVANAQAVVGEGVVLVLVGSYIDVAVIEAIVGKVPVSTVTVSNMPECGRVKRHSRLVKANSVREYLKGWRSRNIVCIARRTKLRADVVGAGRRSISRKCSLSEVPALLGLVLNEGGGIEIALRHGEIKDAGASRDGDWNCHISA